MAVLDSNQTVSNNTSGFDKGIHASARTMMLDNLQASMYQKPIQSAVRECVSNAVDAVKEKNTARKILTGEAKVSDYYLTREDVKDKIAKDEDDIYQDSEFDPNYYDLNWLSDDDTVKLEYINNDQTKRDQFIITDPGVGLGGKRLEGFFSLGFSSKRLNSGELGGFGLGAKSPLATGVESYRMITRYNGKEFCFDIYSHKVDCVYGKWGDMGKQNEYVEFESVMVSEKFTEMQIQTNDEGEEVEVEVSGVRQVPYKAYYKTTALKNGTSIIMDVKKHNRSQYFEAVRSQLMYLKVPMTFTDISVNGSKSDVQFKAAPIYEDDDLILSDYGYYARPHFVIKGVSYGLIDFNEADLAVKHGNIGIKFNMEDLDVIPSRESVRYTPRTTKAIIAKYASVAKTVEDKIQKELKQDILIDWLRACNKILYSTGTNSNDVVARMSSLTDSTSLQPVFKDTTIKYSSDVKGFLPPTLTMEHVSLSREYSYGRNSGKAKISRTPNTSILGFDRPLYFQFSPGSNRTTQYLAGIHEREGGFCVFRANTQISYLEESFNNFVRDKITLEDLTEKAVKLVNENETDEKKLESVMKQVMRAIELLNYMKQGVGTAKVKIYSSSIVPDTFKVTDNEDADDTETDDSLDEDALEEARKTAYKELLRKRRESKSFIGSLLKTKYSSSYYNRVAWNRREIPGDSFDNQDTQLVFTTDEHTEANECLINIVEYGDVESNTREVFLWNDDVKVVKVAKSNLRYVKQGIGVSEYLLGVEDGILRSIPAVRKAFTARVISKLLLDKCDFMRNFSELNQDVADTYAKLLNYTTGAGATRVMTKETLRTSNNKFANFLNAHYEIQLIMLENPSLDEETVQALIDGAFDKDIDVDITGIDLIDKELYEEAKRLVAFADVYKSIFNYVEPLQDQYKGLIDPELLIELKQILESKKDQLEYEYKGLNK